MGAAQAERAMGTVAAPAVSVVIPVRNGAATLGRQLEALVGEVPSISFDVVVADNGSSDGTVATAQRFRDRLNLRVVDASGRRGRGFAANRGVEKARSAKLVFLDADDEIRPGYLSAMADALDRDDVVGARIELDSLNPGWAAMPRAVPQTDALAGHWRPWAYGASQGFRREVFEAVGGFDEYLFRAAEDVDVVWRAQLAGATVGYASDAVLSYRLPETVIGLFRQGRSYGRGGAQLVRRFPVDELRADPILRGVLIGARLAGEMLAPFPRSDRGRAAFLLGRRVGQLEGWIRPDPLPILVDGGRLVPTEGRGSSARRRNR